MTDPGPSGAAAPVPDGFAVATRELRDAATAAGDAAAGLRTIGVPDAMSRLAAALPGGTAARAAAELAAAWSAAVTGESQAVDGHAADLRASAAAYDAADRFRFGDR